jgi:hypothetical protein
LVFAMGTVKARPRQWLLLGIIRLDPPPMSDEAQGFFPF